ncbi:LPS translocon maturation chaperone LptM [Bradyrhizobium canariense]|uniref:Lipoprotein-attachment site-containing protein n=1 Tax=Bradyrhizobium canariense TaxID=255045 RepID=A0A1H1XCU1_9BRAD|nr:lipoprotein [Bradyrhizobium canariense]SDT07097.1 lipoprotein-attachment site-containing protein [Bradyrhizobium canariense]
MNRISSPLSPRWAIVLLAAAVLTLAGCGRKGPLDLPPTGSQPPAAGSTGSQSSAAAPTDTAAEQASTPSVFNPSYGTDAPPVAPKGAKKSFILDPLLDN